MSAHDLSGHDRPARVLVVTGAGISAPSGVPTYRDVGSGWTDASMERMSHASNYGNHLPQLWGFWSRLRTLTTQADPNAAHSALAHAEARLTGHGAAMTVVTQNVDGLHDRAGSRDVMELHGSIHRTRCLRKRCTELTDPDVRTSSDGQALECAACGGRARPDVVLFGEQLPAGAVRRIERLLPTTRLCLVVGTSGNVWPAAGIVEAAKGRGARCVLVNKDPWDEAAMAVFDEVLLGSADEVLPVALTRELDALLG